eukprot:6664777-Prymnesium_polylepis.1
MRSHDQTPLVWEDATGARGARPSVRMAGAGAGAGAACAAACARRFCCHAGEACVAWQCSAQVGQLEAGASQT